MVVAIPWIAEGLYALGEAILVAGTAYYGYKATKYVVDNKQDISRALSSYGSTSQTATGTYGEVDCITGCTTPTIRRKPASAVKEKTYNGKTLKEVVVIGHKPTPTVTKKATTQATTSPATTVRPATKTTSQPTTSSASPNPQKPNRKFLNNLLRYANILATLGLESKGIIERVQKGDYVGALELTLTTVAGCVAGTAIEEKCSSFLAKMAAYWITEEGAIHISKEGFSLLNEGLRELHIPVPSDLERSTWLDSMFEDDSDVDEINPNDEDYEAEVQELYNTAVSENPTTANTLKQHGFTEDDIKQCLLEGFTLDGILNCVNDFNIDSADLEKLRNGESLESICINKN